LVLQPEHCVEVTPEALTNAAREAIGWATRTQDGDGRWIYRYDVESDRDLGVYEMVRHAGLAMALWQAEAAGFDGASAVADRALDYAERNIVEYEDWSALSDRPQTRISAGASALLLVGLTFRRDATADARYDQLMARLARFLASMVEPSGAVLAYWDPATGAPVPRVYSQFFTGESFWALARMQTVFPGRGWDEPARRIAHYLATERDDVEDRFPDVPDHWAAYGLSEMARWPGETLDVELLAYAHHVAELESMQVRYESQRTNSTWSRLTRGRQGLGAGVGTIGESLARLRGVPGLDTAAVRERAQCAAGLLVERQIDVSSAAEYPNPQYARGAWARDGVTQIDDQQHALSAMIDLLELLPRPVTP
jgi:hypothetical protein